MTQNKNKTQMIHTRVNEKLFNALKNKADENNITMSQLIRLVLQKAASLNTKVNVDVSFES